MRTLQTSGYWCALQVKSDLASDQQWVRQARMLGKHWQHTACCASGSAASRTHSSDKQEDASEDEDEYELDDEYETDDEDDTPSELPGPPARKPMQAMAMPKRRKATQEPQPAGQMQPSMAARRATQRSATESAPAASAYTGTGDYDRRVRQAGNCPIATPHGSTIPQELAQAYSNVCDTLTYNAALA